MVFIQHCMAKLGMVTCVLLVLTACAAGSTIVSSSSTPQVHPTQSTVAAGTLLYQADWSQNLAGWQGAAGWQVHGDNLQIDAKGDQAITAPYQPTVANYAVEVRVRIRNVTHDGGGFIIAAQKVDGRDGYKAEVTNLLKAGSHQYAIHPQCEIIIDPLDSMASSMLTHDYEPGDVWHTYRIEVRGSKVVLYVDDQVSSHATSTQTPLLSHGPIRLLDNNISIEVSNFRITAL